MKVRARVRAGAPARVPPIPRNGVCVHLHDNLLDCICFFGQFEWPLYKVPCKFLERWPVKEGSKKTRNEEEQRRLIDAVGNDVKKKRQFLFFLLQYY
jgi:hypothetical protein